MNETVCDCGKVLKGSTSIYQKCECGIYLKYDLNKNCYLYNSLNDIELNYISEHAEKCCDIHGCKDFDDKKCPVVLGEIKQQHLCEYCEEDIMNIEYVIDGYNKEKKMIFRYFEYLEDMYVNLVDMRKNKWKFIYSNLNMLVIFKTYLFLISG